MLPFLRSETQARVFATLLVEPSREASVSELARGTGSGPGNVLGEVERLVGADILTDRRVGRTRLVRAGSSALVRPLSELLLLTYGPKPLLERAPHGFPGIEAAFLLGSWVSRYVGQDGGEPRDIDLLVVGDPIPMMWTTPSVRQPVSSVVMSR